MRCSLYQRIITAFLSVLPLILAAGCWSSVELNDITFVRGMVVDKTKSGIELSLDMPLPNRLIPGSAGGTGVPEGKPFTYVSQNGKNISEALSKIQGDLSRKINFGQIREIIIGRDMAEAGIEPILEFAARQPSFLLRANLFITNGKGKDISKIQFIFERFPTDILSGYITQQVSVSTTVKDFLMAIYNGGDLIVPMLKFGQKRIESEKDKTQDWLGNGGAAIFRQGKMVNTLSVDEMPGGMLIIGKIKQMMINIPSPTDGKNISFWIRNIATHIKPRIINDQIILHITCKANAVVLAADSKINFKDLEQLKELEQNLNSEVKQQMTAAVDKTRKAESDAFNLGSFIDWYYPKRWKAIQQNWQNLYSGKVKIIIKPHITIIGLGSVVQPVEKEVMRLHNGGEE